MATLLLSGFESGDIQVEGGTLMGTTPVFGSSYKRGSAGLGIQCIGTTKLNAGITYTGSSVGMTANRSNWVRDSFYVKTKPDNSTYCVVAQWNFTATSLEVRVTADGSGNLTTGIYKGGSLIGSTQAISTLTWYTLDTLVKVDSGGAGDDTVGMWIDDTQLANSTTQTLDTVLPASYQTGQCSTIASGTQPEIWHDHLIFNDDQGASQNTRPDFPYVLGVYPTGDGSIGANWNDGDDSGNASYSMVDAVPPVYNSSAGLGANDAIQNRASDTSGNAAFTWPSYATAGATSGDTIKVIQLVASTGSNNGTDTAGAIKLTDYGAGSGDSAEKAIVFDNGVASSAATTWRAHRTTPAYPSVTTAQSPAGFIGKREATTRHAICNNLLIYFGYVTPAAAATSNALAFAPIV